MPIDSYLKQRLDNISDELDKSVEEIKSQAVVLVLCLTVLIATVLYH